MKTLRGIYLDIEESTYSLEYNDFTLYFTSQTTKGRFFARINEYKKQLQDKLQKIYTLDYEKLIVLSLYKKLEKRGFRVYYNNKRITNESLRLEV